MPRGHSDAALLRSPFIGYGIKGNELVKEHPLPGSDIAITIRDGKLDLYHRGGLLTDLG